MQKVLILGGGIAGLSAASFLAEKGYQTEVIESSPKLGGRAYSFTDQFSGLTFDNGQHIMMGCYKETLRFLELIGASDNIKIQEKLEVRFLRPGFKEFKLKASSAPYPFNLISALINFHALNFNDKISLLKIFLKLPFYSSKDLKKITVTKWLTNEGATENSIKCFWEILCIGALNSEIKQASAYLFVNVMRRIFLEGNKNSLIVLPLVGLTEMYCTSAESYIENNNGTISTGEVVLEILAYRDKITAVRTDKRLITNFDMVISTLPYYSLKKVFSVFSEIPFEYSPIISAHIALKENKLANTFWGLIDSPVHWIFNKGSHLSVVISSASEIAKLEPEQIKLIILKELFEYTGITDEDILSCKIIKEKRATFIPANEILSKRPAQITSFNNFFLAGDWVQTDLPATLEGAVLSSRNVLELIISK